MDFEYDGFHEELKIKSDHGIDVRLSMAENGDVEYFYVDDLEFTPAEDNLHGLFLVFDGKPVSLRDLVIDAVREYPEYLAEAEEENRAEDNHIAYMRDPSRYI